MFAVDSWPFTCLPGDMQRGHAEVVKLLLDGGADADKSIYDSYTPLALAAEVNALHLIDLFGVARSPLCSCLTSCRQGMVRLLRSYLKQMGTRTHPGDIVGPWPKLCLNSAVCVIRYSSSVLNIRFSRGNTAAPLLSAPAT